MSTQTTSRPATQEITRETDSAHGMFDGVDLRQLAERIPTPFHAYSASAIRQRIDELQAALAGLDATICFAVKANPNLAILQLMANAGVGADIVSVGELRRALNAGIPAERIVFSGVGKSADEIAGALNVGIMRFNVESLDELHTLQRVARAQEVTARAAVRINPDVDAQTHAKISTGKSENKFGVGIDEARRWFAERSRLTHVQLDGLHVHIGSQILSVEPFRLALQRVAAFWRELERAGHPVNSIDVGGGLGVRYRAGVDRPVAAADYAGVIREALAGFRGRLLLEPGRYLVAEAGVLLTRVIRIKPGVERTFLVLDAAMNDLQRPSLYDAWHDIVPVSDEPRPMATYDIVGPVCETGDTFARARELPECAAGDLLLIKATGAYGTSMASTYNSRPLAAEVLLQRGRYAVVRRRQHFEEMIAGEQPARNWETP
ncbi:MULTISPECIES: diaminopimelate decarboxylase [unclassified Rhodanobacter]|uniref:diaminopimelate decarboxylase n=1 Tax=unclassified Rhodanobacter TaxID=2621553 RepID=UPI001BDEAB71|nr:MULTISPECIES: diaminopimelate decarboxylase [unclassified Rhodanobacter]MBT2143616.1 diaminopimelate decarboxylase [Rhodanobacter sp. LX-99]MBT2147310.1 diaminopimelate decarboxylase [Rhodanobacter sp. LX-100]